MPAPTLITDLSPVIASNSPPGTEPIGTADDYLRALSAFIRQTYNVSGTLANLRAQLDSIYAPTTGSVTYAPIASPTFTGTVTAPAFSGPLTGNVTGTVTGSASLNVLKSGDTMTGTLNGTAVSMSGNVSGAALVPTGSTVPANGVYLPAANTVGIATNSTLGLRQDASGNVGIGATPGARLTVDAGAGQYASFNTSSAGSAFIGFSVGGTNSGFIGNANGVTGGSSSDFALRGQGALVFATGGITERMRIDASGNTTPGANNTQSLGSGSLRWSTVFATTFDGSGASLTSLNATQLASGTVPDARFPATLPAVSGANLTALNASQLTTGTVPSARITAVAAGATINGNEIGTRSLPVNSQSTGYTLVVADRGQMVSTTAGVTVPNSVFAAGDVVTIYNNSAAAITITQGASHTLRQAGTTNTGNRTLAARGIANVTFVSGTESVITGAGVS
ncbi:hypothetical protein IP84_17075 [beta proteobacterium AAP99]|nr:hypothetical protein IP84_17075 [beta proteobacterium AAP99]